jgi:SAM-dependent methyltransferase
MTMEPQVQHSFYLTEKYLSLNRFISYAYQLKAVLRSGARSVLFIGVGDSVVVDLLKRGGRFEVTSMDIDPALHPDVVGDIRKLPFADGSFDVVCVFEVLEHLPFEESQAAIAEIARVAKRGAVVSVPHRRTGFEFVLRFPFIQTLTGREFLRLSLLRSIRFPGFAESGQHYWEIDGHDMPLKRFRNALNSHFDILREDTPVLDSYRRFFDLRKRT